MFRSIVLHNGLRNSSRVNATVRTVRALRLVAVLVIGTSLASCKDKVAIAHADSLTVQLANARKATDSLAALLQGTSADKDRALAQVVEATKFADQVDAELRQVRTLTGKVTVNPTDESGKTQASAAQSDILARLKTLRQRLSARQAQVAAMLDTIKRFRTDSSAAVTLLMDLQTRLAQRDKEITSAQDEVKALRSDIAVLNTEKLVLRDTVKAMDVRENHVFYTVGTRKQLLTDGLVTEEGGSRGLLIMKLGKTLVPARALDEKKFVSVDRREVLTIPLPRADKSYRIVSRHDVGLIQIAKKEKDGSFRGDAIRIMDPAKFWAASRFLIIAEK
ncbi:MAG: hypothetical protein ABJB66_00215 [Gemmatimonadaceae bacterium]